MTTLLEEVALELPDGWEAAMSPAEGTLVQAFAPKTDGFRGSVTIEVYPRVDGGSGRASIDEFHEQQLQELADFMTDALVIDDQEVVVNGCSARMSTIAFRQGRATVTSRVWTIEGPGAAIVIACLSDLDFAAFEIPQFEAMVESVRFVGAST